MNGYGIHSTLINLNRKTKTMFTSKFIETLSETQAEMLWNSHVENTHITFHICGHTSRLKAMSQDISPEQNVHLIRRIRLSIIEECSSATDTLSIYEALKNLKPGYSPEKVVTLYDKALTDIMVSPAMASFRFIPKDENPMASYQAIDKYFGRDTINGILFTALNPVK